MHRVLIERWRAHQAARAEFQAQEGLKVRIRPLREIPPGGWRVVVSPHGTKAA